MKVNCDMGESFGVWSMGADEKVMPCIDMANIACGFHASDPKTMNQTVKLAVEQGVSIGAHPSYPDLLGFGRRAMNVEPSELTSLIVYQIGALEGICRANGTQIDYVKPHGALYNQMMVDPATFDAVLAAVQAYDAKLPLVVMATPEFEESNRRAESFGVKLWFEAFSDRAYTNEGRLADRRLPGAVHQSTDAIDKQVREIIDQGVITTISGQKLPIKADTICIHGDGIHAVHTASFVRDRVSSR